MEILPDLNIPETCELGPINIQRRVQNSIININGGLNEPSGDNDMPEENPEDE